jgi:hypothetical protein
MYDAFWTQAPSPLITDVQTAPALAATAKGTALAAAKGTATVVKRVVDKSTAGTRVLSAAENEMRRVLVALHLSDSKAAHELYADAEKMRAYLRKEYKKLVDSKLIHGVESELKHLHKFVVAELEQYAPHLIGAIKHAISVFDGLMGSTDVDDARALMRRQMGE